jgi:predicted MPP superfamily phosphohydrolase
MPFAFVHLSDIHFGQEKGGEFVVHDDVRERLVEDAADLVAAHTYGSATGVLVTGDIAYAGKPEQYQKAAEWLDRLTAAVGCEPTAVQLVPGNHDIDRDAISSGCKLMLNQIIAKGEPKLDEFLKSDQDREVLYGRFVAYRPFAEGYNCSLDREGGYASDRTLSIAPGRTLRFIGLNSALICSAKDKKGKLLLGARQHVLPRSPGEELVVLAHHPLHWLRDIKDARRYVRSRARVFVSGHEHKPSLKIRPITEGCDLMLLAAGATVPSKVEVDAGYRYTYNLLIFDWDRGTNGLKVAVFPRAWSSEDTMFTAD